MKRTIIIHDQPITRINPVLGAMLVGISVDLRPELLQWTFEPTDQSQIDFYFVRNDDLRAAMTAQLGAAVAHGLYDLLPVGLITWIERRCCTLLGEVAKSPEEIKA